MGDDGLGWIDDRAITFAGWRRVAVFVCGGTRGERDGVGEWTAVGGGGDSVDLGCSIHPSARLSRCVLGELGSR